LLTTLHSRGETTYDLLTHLFAAYGVASDKTFREYATKQEQEWEDGKTMSPQELMIKMGNRYKTLKVKGLWDAPSKDEEKLMAMQTKFNEMKEHLQRKTREYNKAKGGTKYGGKGGSTQDTTRYPQDPTWLSNNEKPDPVSKVMQHKGWPWYYCCEENGGKCGGRWRKHKPSECKGISQRENERNAKRKEVSGTDESNKKFKLMKALEAKMGEQNSSDEEDEEVPMEY
jgi:hypothetical protein